jgi:NADPH2:quinone reductase
MGDGSISMRAMVINAFGKPDVFKQKELDIPKPSLNDLLVRVHATSVNPVDYQTRRGDYKDMVELLAIIVLMYPE